MQDRLTNLHSPLFSGIAPEDRKALLGCITYHIASVKKGEIISFEEIIKITLLCSKCA